MLPQQGQDFFFGWAGGRAGRAGLEGEDAVAQGRAVVRGQVVFQFAHAAAVRRGEDVIGRRVLAVEFGRIQLVDNSGNGNYNSLTGKFTKRYSNGLTYLFSYTFAKSIDTATAIRNQGGDTLFPQNSYCRQCERARSSHDTRQRFVTSFLYDIPIGKGKAVAIENGFANAVVGGWQVGSIITLQSGFPLTITHGGDPSNTGGQFDRPTSTGVDAYKDFANRTPSRWFDITAFTRNVDGTWGNVGRNTMTSPGIVSWDFSMLKDFMFTERYRLQFRSEFFNALNTPYFGQPTGIGFATINSLTPDAARMGEVRTLRNPMRIIQFGLKLSF